MKGNYMRGRKGELHHFYGKKHSYKARRGIQVSNSVPVYIYNRDGEFLKEYECVSDCAKDLYVANESIRRYIRSGTQPNPLRGKLKDYLIKTVKDE